MEKNELMGQLFSADSLQMIRNFKNLFDPENRLTQAKSCRREKAAWRSAKKTAPKKKKKKKKKKKNKKKKKKKTGAALTGALPSY